MLQMMAFTLSGDSLQGFELCKQHFKKTILTSVLRIVTDGWKLKQETLFEWLLPKPIIQKINDSKKFFDKMIAIRCNKKGSDFRNILKFKEVFQGFQTKWLVG